MTDFYTGKLEIAQQIAGWLQVWVLLKRMPPRLHVIAVTTPA
ncbi:MAG TPA: hypothetical protein VFR84_13255 [Candidatus Angelobacter sp.]|nr:hypothetical protein [Candidatus Angelobacter sp.]